MKRIIILAIIGLCISGASMAQGQKLKGRLIDKDHYPVKNAKVTVKGTNLSTTSDKDGNFFIEDVPLYLDSIQVEKGRKDITVNTPMKISMGRLVIDKRFSWFVKAGVGVSRFLGADETKDKVSFHVGGGVDGCQGGSCEQNEDRPFMWWSPHPFSRQNVPWVADRISRKGRSHD